MRTRTTGMLLGMLLVGMLAGGCGSSDYGKRGEPDDTTPLDSVVLVSVTPSKVPADFSGEILLHGSGFASGAEVLASGLPIQSYPGISVAVLDEYTLRIQRDDLAAGQRLVSSTLDLQVQQPGAAISAAVPLQVVPVLDSVEWMRTFPGLFLRNGGFLDVWVRAIDSDQAFVAPGHVLTGAAGLGHGNFQLRAVTLTPVAGGTPIEPDFAGVADVFFDPVGTLRPLAVSLAIDQSGSIADADPTDQRITQAQAFVMGLGEMDQVEVLQFSGSEVSPVVPFTGNKDALKAGLETLRTGENGGTPLYDAMVMAVNDALAFGAPDGVTRAAIVLTDGIDNGSDASLEEAIAAARAAGVPIYPIGLGDPNDPDSLDLAALQEIADQTGGRFLFAADPAALEQVFDSLTDLLLDTYQLECAVSFEPPLAQTGMYTVTGELVANVDGRERVIPLPPFTVNVAP